MIFKEKEQLCNEIAFSKVASDSGFTFMALTINSNSL